MPKSIVALSLLVLVALPAPSSAAKKCPAASTCVSFEWDGQHSLSRGQEKQIAKICTGSEYVVEEVEEETGIRGRRLGCCGCNICPCPCSDPDCILCRRRDLEEPDFLNEAEAEEEYGRELNMDAAGCFLETVNKMSPDLPISNVRFNLC